ncbi:MAG: hypothetical protein AAGL90_07880 [Pseudomonadota bacterium]
MSKSQSLALKAATILWIIWGLVHLLAGVSILSTSTVMGFSMIADAVDTSALAAHDYHPAVGGVQDQHAWNLAWFGLATIVGGGFIWRANKTAIWVTAMIGGLADLGYFIFLDLPGYVLFFPGTVMTLVSGSAILLTGWVYFTHTWTDAPRTV